MADLECENRNDSIFYEITITSKEPFIYQIPWKKSKHRYNYRYSIEEIQWVDKVKEIAAKTRLQDYSIIIMVVKQLLMHSNSKRC